MNTTENPPLLDDNIITYNVKLQDVEAAFDHVKANGTLHSFHGEPWVPNMAESHVQGIAPYQNFLVITHNNKGYATGYVLVIDTTLHKLVQKNSSPDQHFNHPGGIQVIGDYVVVPIENSDTASSFIQFYYLGKMTDIVAPSLLPYFIRRENKGTGCAGITNFTMNQNEHYLLAAYNDGDIDFYISNAKTLADDSIAFSFDFNYNLGLDDCSSVCLLTDVNQNIYLIGLRLGGSWDKAYLFKVDLEKKAVTEVKWRHMFTKQRGVLGAYGVHFRWGAGMQIISPTSIQLYATQRNFVGDFFYTNTFEAE